MACCEGETLKAKLSGIFRSSAFLWRWPFWENLSPPVSQCWEAPGQTTIQVGSQPCPSLSRLPKDPTPPPPPQLTLAHSSLWSHQETKPHLPVGRHQSLLSGSLQQAPFTTSATREADTRSKRGYNSIICKKVTTSKTYKNEKTENYNSDKWERKKNPEKAKPSGDSQPPGKKTLDCWCRRWCKTLEINWRQRWIVYRKHWAKRYNKT